MSEACTDCNPKNTPEESSTDLPNTTSTSTLAASSQLPESFEQPTKLPTHSVTIEFCDRCRWLHRATWVATELMLTFPPPALKGIHLIPLNAESTAGRFRVWLSTDDKAVLVWDRKVEGRFPELKEVKQRVRDIVQPGLSLGHSDKK